MAYVVYASACLACGACEGECRVGAISDSGDGTRAIDAGMCISCGSCAGVCPASAIAAE